MIAPFSLPKKFLCAAVTDAMIKLIHIQVFASQVEAKSDQVVIFYSLYLHHDSSNLLTAYSNHYQGGFFGTPVTDAVIR